MDKRKAKSKLLLVQDSYVRAIKAFERAERYSDRGYTTKALEQRDKAIANIRKAETTIAEIEALIDGA